MSKDNLKKNTLVGGPFNGNIIALEFHINKYETMTKPDYDLGITSGSVILSQVSY